MGGVEIVQHLAVILSARWSFLGLHQQTRACISVQELVNRGTVLDACDQVLIFLFFLLTPGTLRE